MPAQNQEACQLRWSIGRKAVNLQKSSLAQFLLRHRACQQSGTILAINKVLQTFACADFLHVENFSGWAAFFAGPILRRRGGIPIRLTDVHLKHINKNVSAEKGSHIAAGPISDTEKIKESLETITRKVRDVLQTITKKVIKHA